MFILSDKIRQNLRKHYNTTKTKTKLKKIKKEEKRDKLLQVFVLPKTTITNYESQRFCPFDVHFFCEV